MTPTIPAPDEFQWPENGLIRILLSLAMFYAPFGVFAAGIAAFKLVEGRQRKKMNERRGKGENEMK